MFYYISSLYIMLNYILILLLFHYIYIRLSGRATLCRSVGVRSFALQPVRRAATTVGGSAAERNAISEIRNFWAKNEPKPFTHVRPIAPHMTIYKYADC